MLARIKSMLVNVKNMLLRIKYACQDFKKSPFITVKEIMNKERKELKNIRKQHPQTPMI